MLLFINENLRSTALPPFSRTFVLVIAVILLMGFGPPVGAAIVGTNTSAMALTAGRIATLPKEQQAAWRKYLDHSQQQRRADQEVLLNEMHRRGLKTPVLPPSGFSVRSIPLYRRADWYGSTDAVRIARIIVSFQTPAGGWDKNLDLAQQARVPGEAFGPNNDSRFLTRHDFDAPPVGDWEYIGTFDNNATVTELRFLAKVVSALGDKGAQPFGGSFERGMRYIFAAQYPNGGWPQVWPLQGGYHDAITYNDDAMVNVLNLLRDVSSGTNEFAFVPQKMRQLAADSLQRGIACVLATQIVVDGRRTVWCQQHDPLTLQPVAARNFEMPAQVSSESAGIMMFLMSQPHPGPDIVKSVDAAAAWFEKVEIHDKAFKYVSGKGRNLVSAPGHRPIWARFYQIGANRPIFGDRDKTVHDDVNDISAERRNGYSWFGEFPQEALDRYAVWKRDLPK